jgi:putative transposase
MRTIPVHLQPALWKYMAGITENIGATVLAIGGFDDHCHLGLAVPPKMNVSEIVQKVKANSSRWMNNGHAKKFQWQEGFGSFSISISHTVALVRYINNQREHHKRVSFADEWARILEKHGITE